MCKEELALMRADRQFPKAVPLPSTAYGVAVSTENELHDRLERAEPGTAIAYHIGMLARDRDRLATALTPGERDDLNALASRAWRLAAAGWADLVQQRIGEERFATPFDLGGTVRDWTLDRRRLADLRW
jgi:hypothetical protein